MKLYLIKRVSDGMFLRKGPRTNKQLVKIVQAIRPDLTPRSAANRSYQALLRLKDKGVVVQGLGSDGRLWMLAQ